MFGESAPVAQWIEHLPPEQGAAGSTPVGGTISSASSLQPLSMSALIAFTMLVT